MGPRDEVIEDSVEHSERQSFYCVSVPAESPWATEEYRKVMAYIVYADFPFTN